MSTFIASNILKIVLNVITLIHEGWGWTDIPGVLLQSALFFGFAMTVIFIIQGPANNYFFWKCFKKNYWKFSKISFFYDDCQTYLLYRVRHITIFLKML